MAMNIDRENSGIAFENDSENENAPQISGQVNVGGVQYRIAMWENDGKNGMFYGIMLTELDAEEPAKGRGATARRASSRSDSRRGGSSRRTGGKSSRR